MTVTAKELTSQQKEKPHGKKNNLPAKEIRIKMSSQYRRNFAVSLFLFAMSFLFALSLFLFAVRFFLLRVFSFLRHREVILFARSLFLFAVTEMLLS